MRQPIKATLIEWLLIIIMVGILIAISIPGFVMWREKRALQHNQTSPVPSLLKDEISLDTQGKNNQ